MSILSREEFIEQRIKEIAATGRIFDPIGNMEESKAILGGDYDPHTELEAIWDLEYELYLETCRYVIF